MITVALLFYGVLYDATAAGRSSSLTGWTLKEPDMPARRLAVLRPGMEKPRRRSHPAVVGFSCNAWRRGTRVSRWLAARAVQCPDHSPQSVKSPASQNFTTPF